MRRENLLWLGSDDMSLDNATIKSCGDITLGYYGGNTESGAYKNEDGAYIINGNGWNIAMLLDAHCTNESARLVLETMKEKQEELEELLDNAKKDIFSKAQSFFIDIFQSEDFKSQCRKIKGETACLIVIQKENYLWWMSIGDNLVFLLHPELGELNQFALNQRQFYEWIGQVNTFELEIPCYSTGTRLLRENLNYIYLITDGVLECGERHFENHKYLYEVLTKSENIKHNILTVLNRVHSEKGRDSATIIGWAYVNKDIVPRPSS